MTEITNALIDFATACVKALTWLVDRIPTPR